MFTHQLRRFCAVGCNILGKDPGTGKPWTGELGAEGLVTGELEVADVGEREKWLA